MHGCSVLSRSCPVGLKKGGVVDDGREEGRKAPQQQGREELSDDGVIQVFHRFSDVELVHRGDDDSRSGEEEEEEEEKAVDDKAADPPVQATNGQMLPVNILWIWSI